MPALDSKGSRYPKDPWPDQANDLTHRGRPKLGPQQLEPLDGIRMEPNRPLIRVGKDPPRTRVERHSPQAKAERHPPQAKAERHPPPVRAVNRPPQAEVRNKLPQGAWLISPRREKEWVMVPGLIGTKGPSRGWKEEYPSLKGLPI